MAERVDRRPVIAAQGDSFTIRALNGPLQWRSDLRKAGLSQAGLHIAGVGVQVIDAAFGQRSENDRATLSDARAITLFNPNSPRPALNPQLTYALQEVPPDTEQVDALTKRLLEQGGVLLKVAGAVDTMQKLADGTVDVGYERTHLYEVPKTPGTQQRDLGILLDTFLINTVEMRYRGMARSNVPNYVQFAAGIPPVRGDERASLTANVSMEPYVDAQIDDMLLMVRADHGDSSGNFGGSNPEGAFDKLSAFANVVYEAARLRPESR